MTDPMNACQTIGTFLWCLPYDVSNNAILPLLGEMCTVATLLHVYKWGGSNGGNKYTSIWPRGKNLFTITIYMVYSPHKECLWGSFRRLYMLKIKGGMEESGLSPKRMPYACFISHGMYSLTAWVREADLVWHSKPVTSIITSIITIYHLKWGHLSISARPSEAIATDSMTIKKEVSSIY